MLDFQAQKRKVLQSFQNTFSFLQTHKSKLKAADIEKQLQESEKHLVEGKLLVVVAGEFKQGKSSLINAIINEPGLFPVDVDITTSLISTITYGQKEKITVLVGEPGKEKQKQITREEIPLYVTEQANKDNFRQARMLIMESPNEQLKEGLVFVDTPGIGSLNIRHTDITYAIIPNSDAVLFVSDATAPLSSKELEFVKMIAEHCQNIIHVITKIDGLDKNKVQQIVDSNRQKLAEVLKRPDNEIPIIAVSSKLKREYLESKNIEDLTDSNFQELESQMWYLLSEQGGYILLMRAINNLGRVIREIKRPIETEWEVYQEHTKQELDEMEKSFEVARDKLQNLTYKNAEWHSQLSRGLENIRTVILGEFDKGFIDINRKANNYLDNATLVESPQQIAGLLETDVNALMTDIGKKLSREAANLHCQIENDTGLNIGLDIKPLNHEKAELLKTKMHIERMGLWEKTITVTREATFSSTAGATVGTIVGGALGGVIGFFFGGIGAIPGASIGAGIGAGICGVAGAKTGVRKALTDINNKEKAIAKSEVKKVIDPFVQDSRDLCRKSLGDTVKKLNESMKKELSDQIQRTKKEAENALTAIKNARKLTQEQASRRAAELKIPLQQLNQLENNLEYILKNVVEQKNQVKQPKAASEQSEQSSSDDYGDWANAG